MSEPAAWMYPDDIERFETSETYAQAYSIEMVSLTQGETVPLYKEPPQRTWVEIDGDDWIKALEMADFDKAAAFEFFEAKLKELNT